MVAEAALVATAFAASFIGVDLFRRWSVRRNLLDIPNERSSHSTPTPRGGGIVIVLICILGYAVLAAVFDRSFSWGYLAGAIIISAVSWLDDLYSLPFWSRLITHILAAGLLVFDVGPWNQIAVPFISGDVSLGQALGVACTIGWLVWFVNAYNFMDGIDGIAALQALIAAAAWAALSYGLELQGTFLFAGVLAATSGGFLIHNWQPARIFMGDVGSAFLGFTLAAMPLLARNESKVEIPILPLVAVLFVWFFVFDTIFTLLKRLLAKERVWEAHRQHIYQKMVLAGLSHSTVSLIYGSAAAVVATSVCLSLSFGGMYSVLAVSSLLALTFGVLYVGLWKKR
ncbi:MAG TPA: glycosyltransferase family 4 protein [Pyrinomonadaceae bacterium]